VRIINLFKIIGFFIVVTVSFNAAATNGYFAHGYGTKNKGLAGGGVALPQDSMIAATNPAGMVWVGKRWDLGAAIFSPSDRSYTATAAGPPGPGANANGSTVTSENDYFIIPHFGRNWMLSDSSSIGVTVYGNGGMNTLYDAGDTPGGLGTFAGPPFGFSGDTGVDLAQLFISTTYSRKFGNKASWGVSGIVAYQQFEAKGLVNFGPISNDGANLTNNGKDTSTGIGFKVGIQAEVGSNITIAGSYQSRINMSEFDDYAGLFAEKGDFDIPSTWTVGLAWKINPKSALTFDIQRINYGEVEAIANPFSNISGCTPGTPGPNCLGGSNGIGFGWDDMTIFKVGYQFKTSEQWTWRFGYSKGDQPIGKSETLFNILAPAVIEEHYTFGFTRAMGTNNELNFAFMLAPNASQKGAPFTAGGQTVELEMEQFEFELSWAKKA